ncbi:MAG: SAM-dependent chlorinase/fluorinase [Trueperaceae bacterium]
MTGPVFLLSDFGNDDVYVGVVRAVLAGVAPHAPLHDLTHQIAPFDLLAARFQLAAVLPWLPNGSVLLAVVDPGVGSDRRGLALQAAAPDGRTVHAVGPDNGLFASLLRPARAPYGTDLRAHAAVDLAPDPDHRPGPGATFDGRDRFAPAAGRLARGEPLASLGATVTLDALAAPSLLAPRREGDVVVGTVLHVDRFGNLISDLTPDVLPAPPWRASIANVTVRGPSRSFASVPRGSPLLYLGSSGTAEVAVREGNAAAVLAAERGTPVRIGPDRSDPASPA